MPGPQAAAKACQLDLDEVARELCAAAARKENLVYLAGWCPAEAKVIARRECAGRDYTSLQGSKYRDFCSRLKGADMEAKGESDAVPEKRKKKEDQEGATEKGKKLLKGVLGF
jgi:hypothetical protein